MNRERSGGTMISRRDFVSTSVAGAAALSLPDLTMRRPSPRAQRILVLGAVEAHVAEPAVDRSRCIGVVLGDGNGGKQSEGQEDSHRPTVAHRKPELPKSYARPLSSGPCGSRSVPTD